MALRDHFHPPLKGLRHWHSLHSGWATFLAADLNRRLPPGFFAEPTVQFGIEIDVAAGAGSTWAPPEPVQTIPFTIATDRVEVLVYGDEGGPVLAGAVELVSPANKDRESNRDAFVSKCLTYLHQGVGLAVVDIVTERTANLDDELMARLSKGGTEGCGDGLYAVAYRPVEREGALSLDIWRQALALAQPLPTMPLWLRGSICLPLELEATYEQTCRELRVPANGM